MRTVLVTGAASGIGAGIARKFASEGHAVALFDVDGPGVERMAKSLGAESNNLALHGDVTHAGDAERSVNATIERFGSLDVLINNAGIELDGTAVTLPVEHWDRLMNVNLRGAFLMSKFAIPVMKPGSAIVNISSVHAFVAYPGCAAYDASKAGLIGLTRAMALDHGSVGIRVNAVCPGYIETPLTEKWLAAFPDRQLALRDLEKLHPLRRIGQPADIAEAVFFLASERASFISGAFLVVDGGMTLAGK